MTALVPAWSIDEWRKRYVARLVQLGIDLDLAEGDFAGAYGPMGKGVDLSEIPEQMADAEAAEYHDDEGEGEGA